jgi:acetylornithine/succinyldiaminopimelate/putrescine aminotransferase/predicted amino acid dehydrogenase
MENRGGNSGLYRKYCKPKLADLMESLSLDHEYTKAEGDYLYYNRDKKEAKVLDLLGGFGVTFLGHNNQELKKEMALALDSNTPMAAQTSVRGAAAVLAEKINSLIPSKGKYLVNLTNSGAESVEAVLKHAYKAHFDLIRRKYEKITRELNDFYYRVEDSRMEVVLPESAKSKDLEKFKDDVDEYNLAQFELFQKSPVVCAFKGSFHGKTTAPLKVTFNKTYREGFEGLSSIKTFFIDTDKPERLAECVAGNCIEFLVPGLKGNKVELRAEKITKVIAMIFEVILGEGGIRAIPDQTLETLADLHARTGVPFIVDEIQTGCGRTGGFLAFPQTPLKKIEPEYITISKALGGGLVKIGAALIHEKVYDPDFGLLHTSTFAEDELSCKIAVKALEILSRDNGKVMKEAARKGGYFLDRLYYMRKKFPHIIKEVRGKGLMIAIEFTNVAGHSSFFRYAGRQGFLSLLVSSYLLNRHDIRTFAPLSTMMKGNPGRVKAAIIRIQPSAFIKREEIDRAISALEEAARIIDANNEYCMVSHLIGEDPGRDALENPEKFAADIPAGGDNRSFDARTGFIMHPTSLEYLVDYYFPSFNKYKWDPEKMTHWWNGISRFLEPDFLRTDYIVSGGFTVQNNMIAVPYLPEYLAEAVYNIRVTRSPERDMRLKLQEIQDKIQDAVTIAKELGDDNIPTSIVGLGAYTSIVTGNGTSVNDYEVPVTTGNGFTTALMLMGIKKAAVDMKVDMENTKAAVVGGAGNIGAVIASLLCMECKNVKLIGRPEGGIDRLKDARLQCLKDILEMIQSELAEGTDLKGTKLRGLSKKIYVDVISPLLDKVVADSGISRLVGCLKNGDKMDGDAGYSLDVEINRFYGSKDNPFIGVATGLDALKDCEIVAVATNSPNKKMISPKTVKKGAIICCASVPSNLSEAFKDHMDEFFVFDGGFARMPEGTDINLPGMPGRNQTYGCLAETLLLGFDGRNHSFAKGALTAGQVYATMELAAQYGFGLGDFKLGDKLKK